MKKKISLYTLSLLIIATIDSIRNLPAAALFGSSLIFFFLLAAIFFLIPISLVSAELSAAFPEKGGVYEWVRKAFGDKMGMTAIWLQWINTMVWYPTMLSFIAGSAAYLINPELAENKYYLISFVMIAFWTLTLINLKGMHFSSKINSICVVFGTMIPMCLLIALGIAWATSKEPIHIDFSYKHLIPSLGTSHNWISLTAIMASFLGMELAGVHVSDIQNPQRNFPKAIGYAVLFIVFSMLLGSLAIAIVLPSGEIHLVDGVMQVFNEFFHTFHLEPIVPWIALAIVIGSTGGLINWLSAPAKGLLHAAEFGFLPPILRKVNQHGVPTNILLTQALLVSVFCALFLFVPTINTFYWFLTDLSTELYMMMYVLVFCSVLRLRTRHNRHPTCFKIPGGEVGLWGISLLGIVGCGITLFVGFFPPDTLSISSTWWYALMIGAGNLLLLSPLPLFFLYKRKYIDR